jgi:hypothetical protein
MADGVMAPASIKAVKLALPCITVNAAGAIKKETRNGGYDCTNYPPNRVPLQLSRCDHRNLNVHTTWQASDLHCFSSREIG